jgi:Cu/Ag efflux protein CusF
MKKTIAIVLSLVLMFAFTAVSFAAEKAAAPAEKKEAAKKAESKQVTGEVSAVDAKAKTITVSKKAKDKVEDTVISVDDKMLADVKKGDKVTVKFTVADGKNTAKSVKKHEAKAEKKEAPAKKEAAPAKAAPAEKAPAKKATSGY